MFHKNGNIINDKSNLLQQVFPKMKNILQVKQASYDHILKKTGGGTTDTRWILLENKSTVNMIFTVALLINIHR